MAVRNITVDDFSDRPEKVEEIFRERERKRDTENMERSRPALFAWALVLSVFLIVLVYYLSPGSCVHAVSISGYNYLSESYVQELAGISTDSRIFLVFPGRTAAKLEEDSLIADASVQILADNVVKITITEEQPIGYRYSGDEPTILLLNGSEVTLTSELMSLISRVPYIEGFTEEEQTHLLCTAFENVDPAMIEEISEIHQYSLPYDDEAMELQMRDGMIIFASYYSLDVLNSYNEIASVVNSTDNCIYAEQGMKYAYEKACPWNETETTYDYWLDADGNIITNRYGDPAVKHYYQDANGNYYLDASGNWILIPIDAAGNDDPDPDFEANYAAGYYATGTLVIPDETTDSGTDSSTDQTDG